MPTTLDESLILHIPTNLHGPKEIGRGGQAVVIRAWDVDEKPFIVKVPLSRAPEPLSRLARESELLTLLRGLPGVPSLVSDNSTKQFPSIVLQDVGETNLYEHIGKFGESEIAKMIRQIAEVIGAIHAKGVIHRDIKPANIVLDQNDRPHLVDFGQGATEHHLREEKRLTEGDRKLGTAGYRSVEFWARDYCPKSDVFALGATFYHLLTGKPPYDNEASEKQGLAPDAIAKRDQELVSICLDCLKTKAARPSIPEIIKRLQKWEDANASTRELETELKSLKASTRELETESKSLKDMINDQRRSVSWQRGLLGLFLLLVLFDGAFQVYSLVWGRQAPPDTVVAKAVEELKAIEADLHEEKRLRIERQDRDNSSLKAEIKKLEEMYARLDTDRKGEEKKLDQELRAAKANLDSAKGDVELLRKDIENLKRTAEKAIEEGSKKVEDETPQVTER